MSRPLPSADVVRQRLLARARLRHLVVLVQVAELGTTRRAAEVLGMSQPSVTQTLADVEQLLGGALFERHARGMRPTALGQAVLPQVRRLLGALDDLAELSAAHHAGAQGQVRVAAIGGAMAGLLAQRIAAFAQRHPQVLVQVQEANPGRIGELIARAEIDLALCRAPGVLPEGWGFEPLMADRYTVVAGPAHPLARRRKISLDELRGWPWLMLPLDSAARGEFERLFAQEGGALPAQRLINARSPPILWAMLQAQPLLALVPHSVVRQLLQAGQLVQIRLDVDLPMAPIGMMRAHGELHGATRLLAAHLRERREGLDAQA